MKGTHDVYVDDNDDVNADLFQFKKDKKRMKVN